MKTQTLTLEYHSYEEDNIYQTKVLIDMENVLEIWISKFEELDFSGYYIRFGDEHKQLIQYSSYAPFDKPLKYRHDFTSKPVRFIQVHLCNVKRNPNSSFPPIEITLLSE